MQIPQNLPQFEDKPTLLLVCGSQSAKIYLAHNSEIEEQKEFKVEDPEYTDREGHFKRSGEGKTYGSGSVYEAKDDVAHTEFLREFVEHLNKMQHDNKFEETIIFAPPHVKESIQSHLPHQIKRSISQVVEGNYVKQHPSKLLEIINNTSS